MAYHDQTSMGGTGGVFLTTHWSLIEDSKSDDERSRALIGLLLERYWKPVYFYLRRKGHDNEEAKDLTQGFFTEIILDRGLARKVERSKGKFRTLLLTALDHYVISVARYDKRKKRRPAALVVLDSEMPIPDPSLTDPRDAFDYG